MPLPIDPIPGLQADVRTLRRLLRRIVTAHDTDNDRVFMESLKDARRVLGVAPRDPRQDERDWAALQADSYKLPEPKPKLRD